MEGGGNGMSGGILPATLGSGMLDLEMTPLRHQRLHPHHQQQHQQFFPFPEQPQEVEHSPSLQQQKELRHGSSYGGRGKQQPLALSSEEEHSTFVGEEADGRGKQRVSQPALASSPWQRMKWTDGMVRLLIMVVYCVGDDGNGGTAGGDQHHQTSSVSVLKGKKTSASSSSSAAAAAGAAAGLLLQKKGKWKSVSRAMMEKGFYVSPQQCEDKFNDLNKRYKRVNDLLGKGTACRVVENQALLETMDHLSPKAKEEARKLLNSKHLFFREMCAYHNSGGGGTLPCSGSGSGSGSASSLAVAGPHLQPPPPHQPQPDQQQQQQQQCSHHPLDSSHGVRGGEAIFAGKGAHIGSSSIVARDNINDEADEDDREEDVDNDENVEDDYDDEEDDNDDEGDILNHHNNKHHQITLKKHCRDEDDKELLTSGTKRARTSLLLSASSISASPPLSLSLSASPGATTSTSMQQLRCEMLESLATLGGEQQQRHWLRRKVAELEEQRLGNQYQALELERQRLKWLRFSSNKEREMERMKLRHERVSLESDRMLLLLRQKDHELANVTTGSAPPLPVKFAADHLQNSQLL